MGKIKETASETTYFNPNADWQTRIFSNACNLREEAQVLLNSNKNRRALFLAVTAMEEILKIKEMSIGNKNLYHHSSKFALWNKSLEKGLDRLVENKDEPIPYSNGQNYTYAEIKKMFDLSKLRTSLLYEDEGCSLNSQIAINEESCKEMASLICSTLEKIELESR